MALADVARSALEVGLAFIAGAFVFLAAGAFGAEPWMSWALGAAAAILVMLGEP